MSGDIDQRHRRCFMSDDEKTAGTKRPYERPKLITYGDFHTLTGSKGGRLGDGKAKGNTRLSGTKKQ